jgi:hypothetical protein
VLLAQDQWLLAVAVALLVLEQALQLALRPASQAARLRLDGKELL